MVLLLPITPQLVLTALYEPVREFDEIQEEMSLSNFLNPEDESTDIQELEEDEDPLKVLLDHHLQREVELDSSTELWETDISHQPPPATSQEALQAVKLLCILNITI